jgi:hypothetical protein
MLDSAKIRSELCWIPIIDVQRSIEMTVEWETTVDDGEHTRTVTERQVDEYSGCSRNSIDDMGAEWRDLGRRIDSGLRVWTRSSTRSSHTSVATPHPGRVKRAHVR